MRLITWPSRSDQGGAILPVEAQEIDVHASPLELKEMADFFSAAAARALQNEQETFEQAMDFADSKDPNTTPILFTSAMARGSNYALKQRGFARLLT